MLIKLSTPPNFCHRFREKIIIFIDNFISFRDARSRIEVSRERASPCFFSQKLGGVNSILVLNLLFYYNSFEPKLKGRVAQLVYPPKFYEVKLRRVKSVPHQFWAYSSMVRALRSHRRGFPFEPGCAHKYWWGKVVGYKSRKIAKRFVRDSRPHTPTKYGKETFEYSHSSINPQK